MFQLSIRIDKFKVQKLRQHEYELFFTTTILERGVTIDEVAVLVIAAHHKVYSKVRFGANCWAEQIVKGKKQMVMSIFY